jgi:hypothetical protein
MRILSSVVFPSSALMPAFDPKLSDRGARGAVRPDPAGRAFCALLKCAANGLSARRFAEYLSLGQVPDATPDGAPPEAIPGGERWVSPDSEFAQSSTEEGTEELQPAQPQEDQADEAPVREGQLRAPRRWERLLVEAAVIGGRDRWRRRIDGLVNDLRLRLSELAEEDETRAAVLARTLEDLAAFAAYAIPLIDLLDTLPKSANWGEWLDQLGALATRGHCHINRFYCSLLGCQPNSDSTNSIA